MHVSGRVSERVAVSASERRSDSPVDSCSAVTKQFRDIASVEREFERLGGEEFLRQYGDPELFELIDQWVRSRPRPIPPPCCSVCGALWDKHPLWTLLACQKVMEARADKRETVQRYFLPNEIKRHREHRFRGALQHRRRRQP